MYKAYDIIPKVILHISNIKIYIMVISRWIQ